MTEHVDTATATEDRTLPAVVYALYLIGLTHGLTTIIGLIIAYASRDQAGPKMYSHYTWLIRTFWITIGGFVLGGLMVAVGIPLSLVLVGIPIVVMGGLLMGLAWVFMAVRLAIGIVHLARDEAYPRPFAIIA
ncbi:MAG: hypothetical protein JWP50_3233 [Phenylobacterium sp.]|nr:hypothetical protein [Phenylobacterium sp.]